MTHEWALNSSAIEDARDAGDGRDALAAIVRAVADDSMELPELRMALAEILSSDYSGGIESMRRALEAVMDEHFDKTKRREVSHEAV